MKKNLLVAAGLGVVAAVLCLASQAHYAYPGESARLIALWRGLDVGDVAYPLMAFFARLLGGGNLIAPVSGVLAAVALFLIVSCFVASRFPSDDENPGREWQPATVAGAVAAVVFVLSPAVRGAATHLEPRLFDFAWLALTLLAALPFFRLKRGATGWLPLLMGVLCALAFCDSALAFAFIPLCFAAITMAARRQGRKAYGALILFVFAFLIAAPVAANLLGLRLGDHLSSLAREARMWIRTPGWLYVALFATLPAAASAFSARRAFSEPPTVVVWLFHASLSFAVVLAVSTPMSPGALLEPYGVLPVATSAFAAAVAGYLAAFWWQQRRQTVALVAGGLLAAVLLASCLWNLFSFDGDRGAFADKVARKAIEDLGDRTWIVTDGSLDSHLRIVAADMGRELNVVSLARDQDDAYLARLGEVVAESGVGGDRNSELRVTLRLGVLPFVREWFASDKDVAKEVAVWGAPDLWFAAGVSPVPEFLFFGGDEARVPDWTAWKAFDAILHAPKGWGSYQGGDVTNPADRLRLSLRRHLGMVANNRGVWLQDKHRDDEAWRMYELVLREIDSDNICTVFNEKLMVDAGLSFAVAKRHAIERVLKDVTADEGRRYLLWRVGTYYGYIRNPDIFVRLGYAWAKSGYPGEALRQVRRAIEFVPAERRSGLLNMMAAIYASGRDDVRSRKIYDAVLAKDAEDHDALMGLMRIELQSGDVKKARELLARAVAAAGDEPVADRDRALLAMMDGDLAAAKAAARRVVDRDAKDLQGWSLLASVVMRQIDEAKDAKTRAALEKELNDAVIASMEKAAIDPYDYHLQVTKGFALLKKGADGRKAARDAFAIAARSRPDIPATQDIVLDLDISLADTVSAERHAREILRRDLRAPLANYVMGSIALGRGELDEAVSFLRRAVDGAKPAPLAFNDLAEALRQLGRHDEAVAAARKAVSATPGLYVAWETLGSAIIDAGGDLAEAESCIRKACELSKGENGRDTDVRMLVSLARVLAKSGDVRHAKATIRKVQSRLSELSEFDRKAFEEVKKLVK